MKLITRMLATLTFTAWAGAASAIPISGADVLTVGSSQWAQADLFANLSWNDINAVCPSGVCGNGTLNGYDMEDWIWASDEAVTVLFNQYIGSPELGSLPDYYQEVNSTWAVEFFADGWRPTFVSFFSETTSGITHTLNPFRDPPSAWKPFLQNVFDPSFADRVNMSLTLNLSVATSSGAWFYHESAPPPGIPTPATIGLFGLALAGLGWTHRRKA